MIRALFAAVLDVLSSPPGLAAAAVVVLAAAVLPELAVHVRRPRPVPPADGRPLTPAEADAWHQLTRHYWRTAHR